MLIARAEWTATDVRWKGKKNNKIIECGLLYLSRDTQTHTQALIVLVQVDWTRKINGTHRQKLLSVAKRKVNGKGDLLICMECLCDIMFQIFRDGVFH